MVCGQRGNIYYYFVVIYLVYCALKEYNMKKLDLKTASREQLINKINSLRGTIEQLEKCAKERLDAWAEADKKLVAIKKIIAR